MGPPGPPGPPGPQGPPGLQGPSGNRVVPLCSEPCCVMGMREMPWWHNDVQINRKALVFHLRTVEGLNLVVQRPCVGLRCSWAGPCAHGAREEQKLCCTVGF